MAATSADERVRAEAEAIAEAASKEFTAFMDRQRVAQANPQKPAAPAVRTREEDQDLLGWFRNARVHFQRLMRKLAGEPGSVPTWDPVADAGKPGPMGERAPKAPSALPASTISEPAAKPAVEPRKVAETQPGADKRDADARAAKPATKPEAAKPTEPAKPADVKAKVAEAPRPGAKPVPKVAETAPAKVTAAPASAAKDAVAPKAPPVAEAKPPAVPKPGETKGPASAPVTAPPLAKPETAKAPVPADKGQPAVKLPETHKQPDTNSKAAADPPTAAPGKTAMVRVAPSTPEAKPAPRSGKPKARVSSRPAAAACRDAGTLRNGWYTVKQGDSLWRIADRYLGSGSRYRAVHAANRQRVAEPGLIRACQRLHITGRGARTRE